ncbi:replication factor C subunit 1 [Sugiyamaella lignohabitans]|uniref:Replication factor C subunit 1 n=1 Tax=Sugiyamaella lignohabitans TaxID=796027 RepID=A0A170QZK8_9ASCO|nr:replication factor C subunit 1 [Sugiyamaella lignohabitans]ANB16016.1 replication factor C subunit 1 [Sugiyamaella lignohabitans]
MIEEDDDDDEIAVVEPPKTKRKTAAQKTEELEDVNVSEYFAGSRGRRSRTKKEDYITIDDDDDDTEILELLSQKESKPKLPSQPAKQEGSRPETKSPRKASKKSSSPAQPAVEQKNAGFTLSANEILAQIPDAILPEVDSTQKVNFYAKKAQAPQSSGELPEIAEAADNCLAGLTFVFTGIMPNLSREQGQDLVKKYGGKVTTAPSRNTSCVVLGAEAGPKKIQKIIDLKIKAIDEQGFLELLAKMPANGGSGEAAQKAMEKKRQEKLKIEKEVERMSAEMAQKDSSSARAANRTNSGLANHKEAKPLTQPLQAESSSVMTEDEKLWTSKYAPNNLNQICGNKAAIDKLAKWLQNWRRNAQNNFKGNFMDPNTFRAAILHGPPGIGKTTTAHLVAQLQGFDVIENNASDTRSKSLLQNQVSRTLGNTSLLGTFARRGEVTNKSKKEVCLIMDEVDGMSAGDRGGVGAMAALCRTTNIPIILICNERSLPKMRPFDKVTYDIAFRRPDASAIAPRILAIAAREGLKLDEGVVRQLVESTRSDIRQIINLLSTYSTTNKNMDYDTSKTISKQWEKRVVLKPFDIVGKFLSAATFAPSNNISLNDKIELYFNDHDFAPLMVQENYLNSVPSKSQSTPGGALALIAEAAESISDGDLVDRMIHGSQQQWSLMPLHGALSCVRPSYFAAGQATGRFNFAGFLGNNSKAGKYNRLLQELQSHARLKLWGDKLEMRMQYLPFLTYKLIQPLQESGADGIADVIATLDEYYLTKEDWDVIMELGVGPLSSEPKAKALPTTVKSGFTRKYNAMDHPMPYMKSAGMTAAEARVIPKLEKPDFEDVIEEDIEAPEEDEKPLDDSEELAKNKYINIPKSKGKAAKGKSKASTKAPAKSRAKK